MKRLIRFHRGRHRTGERVSDIAARINRDYFGQYDPDGPAWQLTSDKQYYVLQASTAIPREPSEYDPGTAIPVSELLCSHDHRKITYATEDVYSNGMFGLPASNRPITVDMYEEIICTDCGKEVFMDPETGVIVCDAKQGWHDATTE